MSAQLWLQEPRSVLREPGFGWHFEAGPQQTARVAALLASGRLQMDVDTTIYEAVGGHFMGRPDERLASMVADDWELTGGWTTVRPERNADGRPVAFLASTTPGHWSLRDQRTMPAGQGRYLCLLTYDTRSDAGGQGTGGLVTLECGGVWRLELHASGEAVLSEQCPPDDEGRITYAERQRFAWMASDRFASHTGTMHRLWIYDAGRKLVVRNVSTAANGSPPGALCYAGGSGTSDPNQVPHALRSARWRLSGSGRVAVCLSPAGFVPGPCRVAWPEPVPVGDGGSTQRCQATLHGLGQVTPTIEALDETQQPWPQGSGSTAPDRRYGLAWEVSWTSTATQTFYLSGVTVKIDPLYSADGNSGTDVIALTNVADKSISLSREGDLTRERLSANFQSYRVDLASYCQANMLVRYVVDGTTVFRGLTDRADWTIDADTNPATGKLAISAEGLWRRFRKTLWPGGAPFDGRKLTDCLAEVLAAAGLAVSEYSLAAWDYRFPLPEPGEPPAIVYRPGTPIDRILEDLQRKFYGTGYVHYFRLSDGLFVLATTATGTSAATFYQTTAAAATAGLPYQTIRNPQQTLDDSELYNSVLVIGESPAGRDGATLPIIARATDWPSINDRTAFNYVGELWPLVVADPGLKTQAAVNWVCRSLFERHRNPRVAMQWQSLRVNVFPGDVVTLAGANYNYDVKLTGVTLTKAADGPGAAPQGLASYQGEVLP